MTAVDAVDAAEMTTAELRHRLGELDAERAGLPQAVADAVLAGDFDLVNSLTNRASSGAIEYATLNIRCLMSVRSDYERELERVRSLRPAANARVEAAQDAVQAAQVALGEAHGHAGEIQMQIADVNSFIKLYDAKLAELETLPRPTPWPVGNPFAEAVRQATEAETQRSSRGGAR